MTEEIGKEVALTLVFDAGTSGSQVLAGYQVPNYHRPEDRPFLVGSAVRLLIEERYNDLVASYQSGIGTPDDCLVSYYSAQDDQQYYFQVGHEAAMPGFLPVQDPKLTTFVAKILGVLGFLAQYELKKAEKIALNLGCLLPFNEWADRGQIEQLLSDVI